MAKRSAGPISAEIAAAQVQLAQRRKQHRLTQQFCQQPVPKSPHGRSDSSSTTPPAATIPTPPSSSLGWESTALTRALEIAETQREQQKQRANAKDLSWLAGGIAGVSPPSRPQSPRPLPATVYLYPELALAMLQQQTVAVGRIWLLLRHLDQEGQGWITIAEARSRLTGKNSDLRVCGWRQLRNLLTEGEGLFWTRDPHTVAEARIWLRGLPRVAGAFGITRFSLRSVALPVAVLKEPIGTVRAHFYASFHSSRTQQQPIARETLAELSDVSRRTQRTYEEKAGVERNYNWVIGPRYSKEAAQEHAWQRGSSLFTFTDHAGTYGRSGQQYLAWQLPNSYAGPHAPHSRGHQKQTNRKLVDLFMKGITGNGKSEVGPAPALPARRQQACFSAHGEEAVRASAEAPARDHYWQTHRRHGRTHIWHLLPGSPTK